MKRKTCSRVSILPHLNIYLYRKHGVCIAVTALAGVYRVRRIWWDIPHFTPIYHLNVFQQVLILWQRMTMVWMSGPSSLSFSFVSSLASSHDHRLSSLPAFGCPLSPRLSSLCCSKHIVCSTSGERAKGHEVVMRLLSTWHWPSAGFHRHVRQLGFWIHIEVFFKIPGFFSPEDLGIMRNEWNQPRRGKASSLWSMRLKVSGRSVE